MSHILVLYILVNTPHGHYPRTLTTFRLPFPLYQARREDMKTADLLDSMAKAPPLSVGDILLTFEERTFQRRSLIHTVLRIIIAHGGEKYAR